MHRYRSINLAVLATLAALSPVVAPSLVQADDSFTIVALPDTQNYVRRSSNAGLFTQQTQWIRDEVTGSNDRNIQFVTHLGDMVSNGDNATQMIRADISMDVLDGVVKYSTLPGNHDYADTGNKPTGTDLYLQYFGPQRYESYDWYGGADPSGNNSFQRFTAGGQEFIHLALEYRPEVNEPNRPVSPLDWARGVLAANPDTPVILSTHEYVSDTRRGRSPSGDRLYDQFVEENDQVFMVLNGHFIGSGGTGDGEYHQVSRNKAGREVIEVLQDYQGYPNGGDGWLRLIDFQPDAGRIEFETYSPVLDEFQTETVEQAGNFASQFGFDVDFSDRLNPVSLDDVRTVRLRQGVNGYFGNSDKEIRSSGGDGGLGDAVTISIDGDDGNPGLQPNQALVRFDDIADFLPEGELTSATLVLEVLDPGSGFSVHEMLVDWDESTTWDDLGDGVQIDGIEAAVDAVAVVGRDTGGQNVSTGTLEIDLTESIEAYLAGESDNLGWVLVPFENGTNGIDVHSSEASSLSLRPSLVLTSVVPEPASLGLLAFAGLALRRRR